MQLFAERFEQHFDVFDDRVRFALLVERLFLGAFDRVLEHVVQTAEARRLALLDQPLAAAADEQRLHVGLGLREVEQLAAVGAAAHLDDLAALVERTFESERLGTSKCGARLRSAKAVTSLATSPRLLRVFLSLSVSLTGGAADLVDFLAMAIGG